MFEAARAGEAGRGFAVVADEISKLAADSKETATRSNVGQDRMLESITTILGETKVLTETVGKVNGRVQNLAASTEEIRASSTQVIEVVEHVKEIMERLTKNGKKRKTGKQTGIYHAFCRMCDRLWKCVEISVDVWTEWRRQLCADLYIVPVGTWSANDDHGAYRRACGSDESAVYV